MTLGRTSSGAIKIKTDGGTTRAVECACCGGECISGGDPPEWFPDATEAQFNQWKNNSYTLTCSINVQTQWGSCSANFNPITFGYDAITCTQRVAGSRIGCQSSYAGYSQRSEYDFGIGIGRFVDEAGTVTYKKIVSGRINCSVLVFGFFCQPYYFSVTFGDPGPSEAVVGTVSFFGSTFNIVGQPPAEGDSFSVSMSINQNE